MTRDELFKHMLENPYHSKGRKMRLRDLWNHGAWVGWNSKSETKRTYRAGTARAKAMHDFDHRRLDHEHD